MPNGLSDGAVIIDTGLNNSKFFTDAKAFRAAAQGLKQTVSRVGAEMGKSGGAYLRSIQTNMRANREFRDQLASLERQAKAMRDAIDQPGTGSKAYKAVEVEIKQVEAQFDKAIEKRDALVGDNGQVAASNAGQYRHWSAEVQRLAGKLEELEAKQQALANPTGDDIAQYQQRVNAYNQVAVKLEEMRKVANTAGGGFSVLARNVGAAVAAVARIDGSAALTFLRKLAAGAKNAAIQFAKLAGRSIAKAAKSLFSLGRGARQSGNGFQFSLKNVLKYGLGIRSLFVLFNRLRSAIKEGFGELANYDQRVKAALGSLKASLGGLKGSLSAAFAPILTAVAPALTTLINLLTQAVNAVGMFFAAITGQGYYTAAKGMEAIDGAASSASGSAKELKRQLAGFDDLNILSAPDGGGGGSGSSGSGKNYTFEKVPIAEGIQNFVNDLKAMFAKGEFDKIGQIIANGINGAIQKAQDWIKWDSIGQRVTKALAAITGTINGFLHEFDWGNLGATVAEGLNTIVNGLILWFEGIDWAALGRGIGNTLNGLIGRIDWGNIGTLINDKLKALFDFTQNLIITFDPIKAANSIRELLGQIQWQDLADQMWRTAGMAFDKAADFIVTLFGGDTKLDEYFKQGKRSPVSRIAEAIGKAIGKIDWPSILETAKKMFWEAFTGLVDGLLNSEHGKVILTISMAIVGLKFAIPVLIKGLSTKIVSAIAGVGTDGAAAWASAGKVIGDAALLAFDAMMVAYDVSQIKGAAKTYKEAGDAYEKEISSALTTYESIYRTKGKAVADAWAMQVYGIDTTNTDLEGAQKLLADRIETLWGDAPKNWWEALKQGFDEYFGENGKGLKALFGDGVQSFADWLGVDLDPGTKNTIAEGLRGFFSAGLGGPVGSVMERAGDLLHGGDDKGFFASLGKLLAGNNAGGSDKPQNVIVDGLPPIDLSDDAKWARAVEMLGQGKWYHEIDDALNLSRGQEKQLRALEKLRLSMRDNADAANNALNSVGGKINDDRLRRFTEAIGDAKTNASVEVNFVPQGVSPAYLNKPLEALQSMFSPGADVTGRVNLTRNNFATVQGFVNGYQGGTVNKPIDLTRPSWWSTVQGFVQSYQGGNVYKPVDLTRSTAWSSVQGFVGGFQGGAVYKPIDLKRSSAWGTVQGFVDGYSGGSVTKYVDLSRSWWSTVQSFVQGYMGNSVTQYVDLVIKNGSAVQQQVQGIIQGALNNFGKKSSAKAAGGIITAGGRSLSFASGGYLSGSGRGNWWRSARKYASGTSRAHGTMFVAGEAGPEIVGHINGRTEILNKSQLAQTMYSAVTSGMISALRGITFTMPAMATGGIMPYEVSAQIAKSTAEINSTLNANNEDLIQTIISVAGQIVAALNRQNSPQPVGAGDLTAQQVINEINRQTLMFGASPLKGV